MPTPRVSLILPVFDDRVHLATLLSSLQAQSESSLEIVAVDDGSSDGSLALLEAAARRDPRIVLLRQRHLGVSAARNLGLDRARGRWIAFADSDDWLDRRALQTWCDLAEASSADLLVGNGFSFSGTAAGDGPVDAEPRHLLHYQPWDEVVSGAEWIQHAVARQEWPHYVWLQLASREMLAAHRPRFVETMANHSDIVWTLEVALAARRVVFCAAPLYGYRVNPASLSRDPSPQAAGRRARSYLVAMDRLRATAAERRRDRGLSEALTRSTCMQARNFLSLLRKRLPDPAVQRELAGQFVARGFVGMMLRGAVDLHDYLVVLRSWLFLRRCLRRPMLPASEQEGRLA